MFWNAILIINGPVINAKRGIHYSCSHSLANLISVSLLDCSLDAIEITKYVADTCYYTCAI